VFGWKRQYEKGLLEPSGAALVPVKIRGKSPVARRSRPGVSSDGIEDCVEIELGGGQRVRIRGKLALAMLDRLVSGLCGR
jgi:hypothetical protein